MPVSRVFDKRVIFHLSPQTQVEVLYTVYIFIVSFKVNVNTINIEDGS